jgi:hypothetical protein
MKRPEKALDVPCPVKACSAAEGASCVDDKGRALTHPHGERVSRLVRAQADWNKLQEWIAGEPIR